MTPPETDQTLPPLSMICVADGMVVPFRGVVLWTSAFKDAVAVMSLFGEDCESAELLSPHAAIARHETASAALKMLIANPIENSLDHSRWISSQLSTDYARYAQMSSRGNMSPLGNPVAASTCVGATCLPICRATPIGWRYPTL